MADEADAPEINQPTAEDALKKLEPLIGEWRVEDLTYRRVK